MPGFAPSTNGLHFSNDFAAQPLFRLGVGRASLPIGNAADGLCGGMVFAARDLFQYRLPPPPDRTPPPRGTSLFRYLLGRLFASFNLPTGPLRYWLWQILPAGDRFGLHGVAWRTIRGHWPRIRAELDSGRPSPLGVVRTRSVNPLDVGRNHQVLAYGYHTSPSEVTVGVYDPNSGQDDGIYIRFDPRAPARPTTFGHNINISHPVRGFFRTAYAPAPPPAS